jgi:hypothetical protein
MKDVLLLHDNATPHATLRTREATAKTWRTALPHPAHRPDPAPCDCHLLGPVKDAMTTNWNRVYVMRSEVETEDNAVRQNALRADGASWRQVVTPTAASCRNSTPCERVRLKQQAASVTPLAKSLAICLTVAPLSGECVASLTPAERSF